MPQRLKKIVVVGPESTGKSSLCEGLAAHFQASWVPEYAREYLLKHGMDYRYEDLVTIAAGQLELEDRMVAAAEARAEPMIFIDTDLYVMKVWGEFVFGRCDSWILDRINERHYDAYLLPRTDLPWVKDELREYPDLLSREKLFHIYRDILINQPVPWAEVGGEGQQRLEDGIAAVNRLVNHE
jgi:NadR type nicotinamide-nucleotide adenylyltransferase